MVLHTTTIRNNIKYLSVPIQIRLPQDVSDEVDEDPTGNKALWDRGVLNGASQKVRGPVMDSKNTMYV